MQTSPQPEYRYELKYLVWSYQAEELKTVLRRVLGMDTHVGAGRDYSVRSLYYDDIYESAYKEKQSGLYDRRKFRIRVYDCKDDVISLECKQKKDSWIRKETMRLSRREYERIRAGDDGFLLDRPEAVARDFYLERRVNLLAPKLIVDYEREPYVYPAGDVRVTFDREVRVLKAGEDLFAPDAASYAVLASGQLILEIKFTGYLPGQIQRLLRTRHFAQVSASKYCLGVERIGQIF